MPKLEEISDSRILHTMDIIKERYYACFWRRGEIEPLEQNLTVPATHWVSHLKCGVCKSRKYEIVFEGEFGIASGVDVYVAEIRCQKCRKFSLWEDYRDSS